MVRFGLFFLVGATLALIAGPLMQVIANPPTDPKVTFKNALFVQRAMEQAREYLLQPDNKKAVQVLEQHVDLATGKQDYMKLLRQAYRSYITELWVGNQADLAQEYLDRLTIIEPGAANDPTLRPASAGKTFRDAPPQSASKEAIAEVQGGPAGPKSIPSARGGPKPSAVRARSEEDPFDLGNQTSPVGAGPSQPGHQARDLLAQAETEYRHRRFTEACQRFEQAYHADPKLLDASRDRWAYCKLSRVVDQLNQQTLEVALLPGLYKEVQAAVTIAQAPQLAETGKGLLKEIEKRSKQQPVPPGPAAAGTGTIQHQPGSVQGWQVADTRHFRILHNQNREFVEEVARVAEQTRQAMYRKWFGNDGPDWAPRCDLYLHANAQDYSRLTGVQSTSPGHSRIDTDPQTGKIVSRRLDLHCGNPALLKVDLPHETTHVVLAGQFGKHAVPRWADEGIAVLTEPAEKIEQHRRNLVRLHGEGQLFGMRELMQLNDYPHASRISAFYAQSVVLVEFLSKQKSPQVFAQFLRDGLNEGYEAALRRHYNVRDFGELQERWGQVLTAEINRPAATTTGYLGR